MTATGDLIIGNSKQAGQFNQGGRGSCIGGTLNVGGNALVILSADTAILGSQTNLGHGGSLTALNGVQLGNPVSVDATKLLTATGNVQMNANFVNNGLVNGPTGSGQELTFTQAVQGAGSTTGNIEYAASYRPGNSPDAVSVQNVLLIPPHADHEVGQRPAAATISWTSQEWPRSTSRAGHGPLLNGFTPSAGESFEILNKMPPACPGDRYVPCYCSDRLPFLDAPGLSGGASAATN